MYDDLLIWTGGFSRGDLVSSESNPVYGVGSVRGIRNFKVIIYFPELCRSELGYDFDTDRFVIHHEDLEVVLRFRTAHLRRIGVTDKGLLKPPHHYVPSRYGKPPYCWVCKVTLSNRTNPLCFSCGSLLCKCGACHCGFGVKQPTQSQSLS